MVKSRGILLLIVLLLSLLVIWWGVVSVVQKKPMHTDTQYTPHRAAVSSFSPIIVHHAWQDGMHTYSGSLSAFSPCDSMAVGMIAHGSNPGRIELTFTRTPAIGSCTKNTQTNDSFSLSYTAKKSSPPVFEGIIVDGKAAPFSLIEN